MNRILPKGINNIIIQYCFYPIPFEKQLIEKFTFIKWFIDEHWFYDSTHREIFRRFKYLSSYKLILDNRGWVDVKRK